MRKRKFKEHLAQKIVDFKLGWGRTATSKLNHEQGVFIDFEEAKIRKKETIMFSKTGIYAVNKNFLSFALCF